MIPVGLLVSGVLLGGVYALAALGLSLAWGSSRVINLAHGMLMVLGVYIAYSLGLHPAVLLPVVAAIGFATGYLLYRYALVKVAENDVMSLLATFGLSLVFYAVIQLVWNAEPVALEWRLYGALSIGPLIIPYDKLLAFAIASLLVAVLWLFLSKSGVGRAMRALSQSFDAARIVGIDVARVGAVAFGLATAVAMAAGVVLSAYQSLVQPSLAGEWLMVSFVVTALAGVGNLPGLIAAGVLLGVATMIAGYYSMVWGQALPLILVAVVYAVKPEGILARMRVRRV